MDLLRFTTAGSVDDGKSTLIGRLLYDSKSIFEDQLEAMEESSRKRGDENVNLALLTDGLKAEREQGITIDVAYRYFATPKRKFIIADTPGHTQYTRNMVTGASTANLAIILIDARKGVIEQTKRHSFIANLLRIQHLVVAVNKMDLVDYSQEVFDQIVADYREFASRLDNIVEITAIPISASTAITSSINPNTWIGTKDRPSFTISKTFTSGEKKTTSMHASRSNGSSVPCQMNGMTSVAMPDALQVAYSNPVMKSLSFHPVSKPTSKPSIPQTVRRLKPSPHNLSASPSPMKSISHAAILS